MKADGSWNLGQKNYGENAAQRLKAYGGIVAYFLSMFLHSSW